MTITLSALEHVVPALLRTAPSYSTLKAVQCLKKNKIKKHLQRKSAKQGLSQLPEGCAEVAEQGGSSWKCS